MSTILVDDFGIPIVGVHQAAAHPHCDQGVTICAVVSVFVSGNASISELFWRKRYF